MVIWLGYICNLVRRSFTDMDSGSVCSASPPPSPMSPSPSLASSTDDGGKSIWLARLKISLLADGRFDYQPTIVRLPIWLMFISLFWKFTLLPSFIDALDSISGISSDAFFGDGIVMTSFRTLAINSLSSWGFEPDMDIVLTRSFFVSFVCLFSKPPLSGRVSPLVWPLSSDNAPQLYMASDLYI